MDSSLSEKEKIKLNVVFYYPPVTPHTPFPTWEPLQIIYLARMMRANHIDVHIIDGRLVPEDRLMEELNRVVNDNTVCFGITSLTCYQILKAVEVAGLVKSHFPNLPVVFGGWHATIFSDEFIERDEVDILIKGQGERPFLEVVKRLLDNGDLTGINGVYWKRDLSIVKENQEELEPVDDLPPLLPEDFALLDLQHYQCGTTMFYMSSRGCPYSCTYCCIGASSNRKWVGLSAENVLFEVDGLLKAYCFKELVFWDNVFFVNKKRVEDICRGLIQRKINLSWSAHGRINEIIQWDDEFVSLLSRSGCKSVYIGIESGSQNILDTLNKGIKARDVLPALTKLKAHNISVAANYMVGLPGEHHSDIKKTIKSVRNCLKLYEYDLDRFQIFIYRFVAFPKTKIFKDLPEKSLADLPSDSLAWGEFIHYKINDGIAPWEGENGKSLFASSVFYLWAGYLRREKLRTFPSKCLKRMAQLRVRTGCFRFPIEWHIWKILRNNRGND